MGEMSQDPRITAALLRLAEAVPRLAADAEALLRADVGHGSRAASDLGRTPASATEPTRPLIGLEPRLLASDQVASALDHLATWRAVLLAGQQPTGAHMTLLRSAILAAAVARWLVDRDAAPQTRLERAVAWLHEDYRLRAQVERLSRARGGPDWRPATERAADLDAAAAGLGLGATPLLNDTDMVKAHGPHRRKDRNEVTFAVASAYAHSRPPRSRGGPMPRGMRASTSTARRWGERSEAQVDLTPPFPHLGSCCPSGSPTRSLGSRKASGREARDGPLAGQPRPPHRGSRARPRASAPMGSCSNGGVVHRERLPRAAR
jgi:hypothetical protein